MRAEVDLRSNVLDRKRQRAYLARYGRQDYWERRSIVELDAAIGALSEIVGRENELSRAAEDR